MSHSDDPGLHHQVQQLGLIIAPGDPLLQVAALIMKASSQTPPNGAVVYSGEGNKEAAATFVHDNPGYQRISDTPMGKALNEAIYDGGSHADRLSAKEIRFVEGLASAYFVDQAKGQLQQFTQGSNDQSIYRNIEIHAAVRNWRVTEGVERSPETHLPLFLEGKDVMSMRATATSTLAKQFEALIDPSRSAEGLTRQAKLVGRETTTRADKALDLPAQPELAASNANALSANSQDKPRHKLMPRVGGVERSTTARPLGDAAARATTMSVSAVRTLGGGALKVIGGIFAFLGGFSHNRSSEDYRPGQSIDEARKDHAREIQEHNTSSENRQRTYDESMRRGRGR